MQTTNCRGEPVNEQIGANAMSTVRQEAEQMIAAFLARGGHIRKCPAALPTTVADVLQYLHSRDIEVATVMTRTGVKGAKYLYGAETLNSKELVDLANRHRRRQRLPPFDLGKR
jgi:hypothetical protein